VTLEEATAKTTELNIMFMETSAKAGHNVKSLFKKIAMSLPGMEKEPQGEANTSGCSNQSQVFSDMLQKSTSRQLTLKFLWHLSAIVNLPPHLYSHL